MLPHCFVPLAARVQNGNQRLVHSPREVEKGQHIDWRWEVQLLGHLADDGGKDAVNDACFGTLFLGFALPPSAVEPVGSAAGARG